MDQNRFDALAKWTAVAATRRRGLALVALLGLGAALPYAGEAHKNDVCNKKQKRCGNRCIHKSRCCTSADCPAKSGQRCQKGFCRCPENTTVCGAFCIPNGATCCLTNADCLIAGQSCIQGQCVAAAA